ncbi:hypothetical protein SanaruYs_07660 [Chryseotalea sanaruensis]|uniref:DUF4468 domain-containing protein n=1 Tax=Chryseotalea sanaruensis TaxID=2482724 RepID=A0A401U6I7_9BACT|nr:hypothetical protein [Chryseotalea sanaruensis]GCC50551.1 hypothetical protein SanaruYs_07660 [Chryseotalea sanaruensis]
MKRSLIYLALFFSSGWAVAQNSAELEKRNGFKDIKLGTPIDSIKGATFKSESTNKEGQLSKIYAVDYPVYKNIGDIIVEAVELTTYKGLIYIIKVVTVKDTRLMKGMELALGKSEWDLRNEQYFWKSENLILTFKAVEKDKIELTYTSFPILKKMKDDKKKEVENIADDF